MLRASSRIGLFAALCSWIAAGGAVAAPTCPEPLSAAQRLLVVQTPTIASRAGYATSYVREDGEWRRAGPVRQASVGANGVGWAWPYKALARPGEPRKREGDLRAPAGIFALGGAFGFGASAADGAVRLARGRHYCVDDPASPLYNQIVSRKAAGAATSGEEMWRIPLYRRGMFIDYPTSAAQRGGSCIFLHVWRRPGAPTAGCVAFSERDLAEIQSFAADQTAAIAVLAAPMRDRFGDCLPKE